MQKPRNALSGQDVAHVACHHPIKQPGEYGRLLDRLRGGPVHTPFQSAGFIDSFARTMAPQNGLELSVTSITDRASGAVVMLVPHIRYRRGPVGVLSFPDFGLADLAAPIFSTEHFPSSDQFASAWSAFLEGLSKVDVLDLRKISPEVGQYRNPLYSLANEDERVLFLDLQERKEAGQSQTCEFKKLRSKKKKLQQLGVRFYPVHGSAQCLELVDKLHQQRHLRFEQLGRDNSLDERSGFIDFYRDIASTGHDGVEIQGFCLKTEEEVVAAYFAFVGQGVINGVLISIGSEAWHRLSPGMVLTSNVISWARQAGFEKFSFGTGMQAYKSRFGGIETHLGRISKPLSLTGRAFCASRSFIKRIKQTQHTCPATDGHRG